MKYILCIVCALVVSCKTLPPTNDNEAAPDKVSVSGTPVLKKKEFVFPTVPYAQ